MLCFPSCHTHFILFSFAPKLFCVYATCLLYPQLLSSIFSLSPGSSVFAYRSSVLAIQAADHWQCIIYTGQYLLAHECLITLHYSAISVCLYVCVWEWKSQGCTLLIRSNSLHHLLLEVTQHTHTLPCFSAPSLSSYLHRMVLLVPKPIVALDVFIKGVCASQALNFNKTFSTEGVSYFNWSETE